MEIEFCNFKIEENGNSYEFIINNRKYVIVSDEFLDCAPEFFALFFDLIDNNQKKIENLFKRKNENQPRLCTDIKYQFLTKIEYYLMSLLRLLESAKTKKNKTLTMNEIEKDKCSICLCDLYEKIEKSNLVVFLDNLSKNSENEPILLSNCFGHYFHFDCLIPYCKGKQYIKCPVCSFIYGTMIGDGPDGKMDVTLNENLHCKGYEKYGTLTINYQMFSGKKNEINYPGTHRIAYLPNNKEGNEVLILLKKAFDRKLIFVVGDSVTTGAKNVIVWNGVHHKTNLYGGSSHFGYPDETYFTRVKLELADKGVV